MKKIQKTMKNWDFCLFLVNMFSSQIFEVFQAAVSACDPFVFKCICMIITYTVIKSFLKTD